MDKTIRTKVILAEDHIIYLDGLFRVFEGNKAYEVVATARNGEQLVRAVALHKPEVVITDINMPIMSGIEAIEQITGAFPEIHCLVLTQYDTDHLIMDALEAGASGYINKAMSEDIFEAIETVMRGEHYYCKSTTQRVLRLIARSQIGKGRKREELFNENEKKIIELFCEDKLLKEIADEICLSDRTVERYKSKIMEKMGVRTTGGIVRYAIRNKLYRGDM